MVRVIQSLDFKGLPFFIVIVKLIVVIFKLVSIPNGVIRMKDSSIVLVSV